MARIIYRVRRAKHAFIPQRRALLWWRDLSPPHSTERAAREVIRLNISIQRWRRL